MKIVFYARNWDHDAWIAEISDALPEAEIYTPDNLEDPAEIDYALVWKPDNGFLATLPNLKVIFSLGAGVDFLFEDPQLPNVPIVRVIDPDLTNRMSEYVVLQCLLHHRRTLSYLRFQAAGIWQQSEDPAASEVRVSVLGLGVLGQDAARKLQMMGYDVAGWSRSPRQIEGLECYAGEEGLKDILARTDILVSLLPHTEETTGILNYDLFGKLAQDGVMGGPVLINAGRGKLQIEDDILKALDEGILIGASLDVFEKEPLDEASLLWSHPAIIITPHNSAISSPRATIQYQARQMRLFESGQPMESVVDRKRGY